MILETKAQSLRAIRESLRSALNEAALCNAPFVWKSTMHALVHTMEALESCEAEMGIQSEPRSDLSAQWLEAFVAEALSLARGLQLPDLATTLNSALEEISGRGSPSPASPSE